MKLYLICKRHKRTAIIGRDTLVSELECIDCVDEQDAATEFRPCCPHMNTTCCGHDDDEPDPYPIIASIDSPNYCNDLHSDAGPPF